MKWWPVALVVILTGCSGPVSAPPGGAPKATVAYTSLSNGAIGFRIGQDGLPEPKMWIAAQRLGVKPDPITEIPFPVRLELRSRTSRGGSVESRPVTLRVVSSWLKPSSNSMVLRLTDGSQTLEVEYKLHPSEPAISVDIHLVRGDMGFDLKLVRVESPMLIVASGTSVGRGMAAPGLERHSVYLGPNTIVSTSFILGDADLPRMADRLRVPKVEIEGDEEAAAALNGMMARLVSGYRAGECWGPFGLTDGKYDGRAFWDLDVWIQPAMVFLDPETSKKAAEWRAATLPQAKKNYDGWVKAGRPVSDKKKLVDLGPRVADAPAGGAMFAWESAMDGTELSTAPTRYEHHLTGSVCVGLQFAELAGLIPTQVVEPVKTAADVFYAARSTAGHNQLTWNAPTDPDGKPLAKDAPGRDTHDWEIKSVVSPDEWHTVDNDLYTNSLAIWLSRNPQPLLKRRYRLPVDDTSYLAYDGDEVTGYQQASALLAVWPLGSIKDPVQVGKMYDRFVGKEARQGPAMTKSLNALVAARLGRTDEALKQWNDSWKLYTDDPALRFREKQKDGEGYFYTGAAGCVNAFIYGFLGLKIEPGKEPGSKPLLHVETHLPAKWKRVVFDGFWVHGERLKLEINGSKTILSASD